MQGFSSQISYCWRRQVQFRWRIGPGTKGSRNWERSELGILLSLDFGGTKNNDASESNEKELSVIALDFPNGCGLYQNRGKYLLGKSLSERKGEKCIIQLPSPANLRQALPASSLLLLFATGTFTWGKNFTSFTQQKGADPSWERIWKSIRGAVFQCICEVLRVY